MSIPFSRATSMAKAPSLASSSRPLKFTFTFFGSLMKPNPRGPQESHPPIRRATKRWTDSQSVRSYPQTWPGPSRWITYPRQRGSTDFRWRKLPYVAGALRIRSPAHLVLEIVRELLHEPAHDD